MSLAVGTGGSCTPSSYRLILARLLDSSIPVDHYGQVHKTLGQSNLGDVGAPDLVGSGDLHTP